MNEQGINFSANGGIDLGSTGIPDGFDPFGAAPEQAPAEASQTPQPTTQVVTENPQAQLEPAQAPQPQPVTEPKQANVPPPAENPLAQAMDAAEDKEAEAAKESIFTRPPKFEYVGASEDISDTSKTFEDLRLDKAADFPELEDGKRVSWSVEYGKITKQVSEPKGTTVGKMKTQIETSKEFLEALKKMKPVEREGVTCKVKPRVTAQSKGELASYKGIFNTYEDAEASGKIICFVPARDGQVYEMRKNEIGTFITHAGNVPELSEVKAGFIPALPLIPIHLLRKVVGFFRSLMNVERQYEALVHILWDKHFQVYCVVVPEQTVSKISVHAKLEQDYDAERHIHVMDIHSHNDMAAKFSATDNADEKATRLYTVIGRLDRYWPSISVRISNGGKYLPIEPELVFEDVHEAFPAQWTDSVKLPESPDYKEELIKLLTIGGEG